MDDHRFLRGTLKQLQSFILPFTVTIFVPALILTQNSTVDFGGQMSAIVLLLCRLAGGALILAGVALLLMTIRWFVTIGHGTLAPWSPTQRLVVVGIYRYVRNPMITGVIFIVLGEALVFVSFPLLFWALAVITINLIYIPLSEEPGLRQRFGADYDDYMRNVPRWLPRLTPWSPQSDPING